MPRSKDQGYGIQEIPNEKITCKEQARRTFSIKDFYFINQAFKNFCARINSYQIIF